MALKGLIKINGQVDVPDAYHRVDGVTGGKRGYMATMHVFATREAAQDGMQPLKAYNFAFPYAEGRDPVALAYLVAPTVEGVGADLQPVLESGQKAGTLPAELQPKARVDAG